MKKLYILLTLINFSLSAQIKGIVKDSVSGLPIPYVNIWVENENIGATSEENGTFEIKTSDTSKTLIFSVIGYETKKISASNSDNIVLKPIIYQLEDVVIFKPKNTKEIEIGDSKKRFYLPEPQTIPWIFGRKFTAEDSEIKFIKNIIYYTNSEVEKGIFRVRIYSIGNDGIPNEDILPEEQLVEVKKGKHKTIVDLLKYKIEIPNEGIIVAFESLLIDQNKYIQSGINIKTKKRTEQLNYSPHIMYFYNNTFDSYTFRAGKWMRFTKEYYDKYKQIKVIIPAIDLTLTN